MAKKIEPNLKKIGNYLQLPLNATFIIPEYQRAYSWDINQCDKLWQDIINFIDSTKAAHENKQDVEPYFFGTIIINCQNNDNELVLIDGQQRTTTFIILLKALLINLQIAIKSLTDIKKNKEVDPKEVERLKLTKEAKKHISSLTPSRIKLIKILFKADDSEYTDIIDEFEGEESCYPYEERLIYKNNSVNERYKYELQNILRHHSLEEIIKNAAKKEHRYQDNRLTNYVKNFKFFYEKIHELDVNNLYTIAEYILNKLDVIDIRSWDMEQAITMFNSLNSDGLPLYDADIISAKLYSNAKQREEFNKKWKALVEVTNSLKKSKVTDINGVLTQFMRINQALLGDYNVSSIALRSYYNNHKELIENPIELCDNLLRMANIWDKIKDYAITKVCLKFNENLKTFLIAYLFRFEVEEVNETIVEDFAEELLKIFALLETVVLGYSSAKFKVFLYKLNLKLVDPSIPLAEIRNDINEHISKNWEREAIAEEICDYVANPLVILNEYISAKLDDKEFSLENRYDIEHIMPMSGKNNKAILKDANISDTEEFMSIVSTLGNKILLESDINNYISNTWFREKINSYKDSKFNEATKIQQEYEGKIEKAGNQNVWTKEAINKRTKEVAQTLTDFIFSKEKLSSK